mgnify:CR=1 FL=1|tara:strand:- start:5 stop:1615 length:1611 start_codon:yes stop_codon:yes gene_type:complete
MRFYQFKIVEDVAVDPQVDNEIKKVVSTADTPEQKKNVIDKIKDIQQDLQSKVQAILQKYGVNAEESIDEDQTIPEPSPNADKQTIFRFARETLRVQLAPLNNPAVPPQVRKDMTRETIKAMRETLSKGRDVEFQSDMEFVKEYDELIKKVSAKTTGTLEALEAHYNERAKKQANEIDYSATTEGGDPIGQKLEVETRQAPPPQTQVAKAVEDTLRSVFSGPAFQAKTREDKFKTRELLKEFLTACIKGFLPLASLLDRGSGNVIKAFEQTKFKALTPFFNELLGKVPSGSGAGSWGPAELALSVVGTPVEKADKGDLNIGGGRKIELKASRKAKSGGRVNTEAIGTGFTGKGNYDKAWKPFSQAIGIGQDRYTADGKSLIIGKTKKGDDKTLKYTSWGPTLINDVINPAIEESKVDRATVAKFVKAVALAPVVAEYQKLGKMQFRENRCVSSDGKIDDKAFVAEYLNMVMHFYVKTDEVAEVLVINPDTGNYHVVDARTMDTLHDKVEGGDIQLSTTYLDFTDNQSKASPQIGTA